MNPTQEQLTQLSQDGYTILPQAVPRALVDDALRAINHCMGQGMEPSRISEFASRSYCPELKGEPVISDLFNASQLRPFCENLVGEGNLKSVNHGQIALRFPRRIEPPFPAPQPHLDGIHSPNNGVPEGEIHNFTMLCGVLLSDLPIENAGNFSVWPGSHRGFEAHFREHGYEALKDGTPKIEMPAPRQIIARAGDAVVCHYQLAHGIAPNVSPNIRYAIFFRLKHRDHDAHRFETLTDLWLDWPGIRHG